jgi:membrane-bound lytic murein transglycosylase D
VVRSGDSLWNLARRYGTTVPKIMAANNLSGQTLSIGQHLVVPTGQAVAASRSLKTYNVRRGDTPFMIAKRFKMPLESLLRINRLTPRCTIYPGQELKVQ